MGGGICCEEQKLVWKYIKRKYIRERYAKQKYIVANIFSNIKY